MYKTFVYSPEVRCVIEGVDVSADVVSGSVRRVVDGASSLSLTLSNKDFRYTRDHQFRRMDRVVVWLRRVGEPIKVFTGYLNVVPGVQLYSSTVRLEASCTLKRLLYTFWDPGLQESRLLLNQQSIPWGEHPEGGTLSDADSADADADADSDDPDNATPDDELPNVGGGLTSILDDVELPDNPQGALIDGADSPGLLDTGDTGLAMMLMNILTKVGGWDPEIVHIANFPETFFKMVMANMPEEIGNLKVAGMEKMRDMFDFYEKIQGGGGGGAIGGLGPITASQIEHAKEIRRSAKDNGLEPLDDACIIGYMVALQESGIRILANAAVPESVNMPNEGMGGDHDSVGIFQQRQAGWGTLEQRMNAYASANMFYAKLKSFDWQSMGKGAAGQKVQVSAYPDAYDKWEGQAKEILSQVKGDDPDAKGAKGEKPSSGAAAGAKAGAQAGAQAGGDPKKPSTDKSKEKDTQGPDTSGMAVWESISAVALYKFPMMTITSAYHDRTGPNDDGGYHGKGQACDISNGGDAGTPEMKELAQWWYENFLGKGLLQLIHSPFNNNVGDDQNVGDGMSTYYNPGTMAQHRNHVHIAMAGVVSADGTTDGITGGSAGGGGGNIKWENKLAKNLFTYIFTPDSYNDELSEVLTGKHASLNDQPLIKIVKALCGARMCHFQSGPDGSFNAFYPDYFGLDGSAPALTLEDIEVKDFTIMVNDNALATHVFSQGSQGPDGTVFQGVAGYLNSPGLITVEDEWLFKLATQEMYLQPEFDNAEEFLGRYGIRPYREEPFSNINSKDNPAAMLVVAIKVFMEKWAQQYETQVSLTFMPELFPGMRLILASHNLGVYVQSVTHTFDYSSGFSTQCSVMAPMVPRSQAERDAMWESVMASNAKKKEEGK